MNIIGVEYSKIDGPVADGVRVVFAYDENVDQDSFDVYGEPDTSVVMNMIQMHPDPGHLLVALRRMANLTVH